MRNLYGVYIGEHLEVVITEKYTLVYRRNSNESSLDSYMLKTDGFICIGVAKAVPIQAMPDKVLYALHLYDDLSFESDDKMVTLLNKPLFKMESAETQYIFTFGHGNLICNRKFISGMV